MNPDEVAADASSFDFGKKKKKKKPKAKKEDTAAEENPVDSTADAAEGSVDGKQEAATEIAEYPYDDLLQRVFKMINASGEGEQKRHIMKPPVVYREGTRRIVWVNFPEICKIMSRSPEHVLSFVLAELGTTGSIDGNGRFNIKGRFQSKHIERLLKKYIAEYVKCHTCKTPETILKRENRLLFMICKKCQSTRSVAPIKTGFQVTTRAGRRAARS